MARISSAGQIQGTFSADLRAAGRVLSILPFGDNRRLIGGSFGELDGVAVGNIAALTQNDDWDTDLPHISVGASRGFATNDGGVVLLQSLSFAGSAGVVRLLPNGQIDANFLAGVPLPNNGFEAGVQQPTGEIILAGRFGAGSASPTPIHLMRLLPGGGLDPSFNNRWYAYSRTERSILHSSSRSTTPYSHWESTRMDACSRADFSLK